MTTPKSKRPTVTLRFKSTAAKDYFLGQLSDGWGENMVALDWPRDDELKKTPVVDVTVLNAYTDFMTEVLTRDDANPFRKHRRASLPSSTPTETK